MGEAAIQIRLGRVSSPEYARLVEDSPAAIFYHSPKYLNFLRDFFGSNVTELHLFAWKSDELVGALPAFVRNGEFGPVVNSLPFYGSHGGPICRMGQSHEVIPKLIEAFWDSCDTLAAISSTIIDTVESEKILFPPSRSTMLTDRRISQVSPLPATDDLNDIEGAIFEMCHSKTRNLIRKGLKSGFRVAIENSQESLKQIWELHEQNMLEIGGLAKPWRAFEEIPKNFLSETDYRVYTARQNGELSSALLLFYFRDTVEYFTPVIASPYRSQQPLSLLIFTAMVDAVNDRGSRFWNWGGTWESQQSLRHFKSRWGAIDRTYDYHVRLNPEISLVNSQMLPKLMEAYPYFYIAPMKREAT